jgi:hypothetical protein
MIHAPKQWLAYPPPAQGKKDRIMKILMAAALVSFALAAPTLAMPIASPAPSAHAEQAIVQVYYAHYRGGGYGYRGRHVGWGHHRHYGWGHGHRYYRRY